MLSDYPAMIGQLSLIGLFCIGIVWAGRWVLYWGEMFCGGIGGKFCSHIWESCYIREVVGKFEYVIDDKELFVCMYVCILDYFAGLFTNIEPAVVQLMQMVVQPRIPTDHTHTPVTILQ